MKKFGYALFLCILVFSAYRTTLQFTFWKDDWFYLLSMLTRGTIWTPIILLHPGTYVEFLIMSHLVGTSVFWWQLVGLVLRVVAALSVALFTYSITKNTRAGTLAGICYAVSPIGLESTVWASARVVQFMIIFLCLSVYFYMRYKERNDIRYFVYALLSTIVGIAVDPIRAIPIVIFISLLCIMYPTNKNSCWLIVLLSSIFGITAIVLIQRYIPGGLSSIRTYGLLPSEALKNIHFAGQYFNSLFNLMTNWFTLGEHYVNEASHGIYSRLFSRLGFIIILGAYSLCVFIRRTHHNTARIIFVFLTWLTLFYLPNWMSSPQIIATGNHRYLALSNVGFVALVAYLASKIRSNILVIGAAGIFVLCNIVTTNTRLTELSQYRSVKTVDAVWNYINSQVTPTQHNVFLYSGEEPVKTNIFTISGAIPFAVKKKITTLSDIPVVALDESHLASDVCDDRIPANTIYAWDINNMGIVVNKSIETRSRIEASCK